MYKIYSFLLEFFYNKKKKHVEIWEHLLIYESQIRCSEETVPKMIIQSESQN
jgi:hypothetical protein